MRRWRCAHGSHSRRPTHSTSPTLKRRPTSALRSMPRVTTLRRASAGGEAELVDDLGLDQREVVAVRVRVGERPPRGRSSGRPRGRDRLPPARFFDELPWAPRRRGRGRAPRRCRSSRPRLGRACSVRWWGRERRSPLPGLRTWPPSGVHASTAGRRAVGDGGAVAGEGGRATARATRTPWGRSTGTLQPEPARREPDAPGGPRLGVLGGRSGNLIGLDLEDRRQAGGDRAGSAAGGRQGKGSGAHARGL